MDAREKKRALRREILAQRNRLKPEEKEKMDRQILKRLLDWEPLASSGRAVQAEDSCGGSPGGGEGDGFLPDPWKRGAPGRV